MANPRGTSRRADRLCTRQPVGADGGKRGVRGYDAGKRIKGRKRHILTDTLGTLLAVVVHSAGIQDRDGADDVMSRAKVKYSTLTKLYVDGGYAGKCAVRLARAFDLSVEVVKRNASKGGGVWQGPQLPLFPVLPAFQVLPRRWVVERTNAWTDRPRRLAKDQDLLPAVAEAWVWFVHASLLMRRIAAA